MATSRVTASASIPASAAHVYSIIADYASGHPRILPTPPFVSLTVEHGGIGAGTEISFRMRILFRTRTFRARVDEPEPGRVLTETDLGTGAVTTFTVEPRDGGAHVTIETQASVRDGLPGAVEAWLTTRLLRPVYVKELKRLAEVARA